MSNIQTTRLSTSNKIRELIASARTVTGKYTVGNLDQKSVDNLHASIPALDLDLKGWNSKDAQPADELGEDLERRVFAAAQRLVSFMAAADYVVRGYSRTAIRYSDRFRTRIDHLEALANAAEQDLDGGTGWFGRATGKVRDKVAALFNETEPQCINGVCIQPLKVVAEDWVVVQVSGPCDCCDDTVEAEMLVERATFDAISRVAALTVSADKVLANTTPDAADLEDLGRRADIVNSDFERFPNASPRIKAVSHAAKHASETTDSAEHQVIAINHLRDTMSALKDETRDPKRRKLVLPDGLVPA